MTTRDTGLTGSSNTLDSSLSSSSNSTLIEQQQQQNPDPNNNNDAMSTTTVYSAPYYPPATYNHNQSNPPLIYRRPSQPGLPTSSAHCTPVPSSTSFSVSDQQQGSNTLRTRTGPPHPPSMLQQYAPALQHSSIRTNTNTPVTHTLSQPHPRIPYSTPPTPIDPVLHLDIVNHPVTEIVSMLAAKLQNLITTNDRIKHSSSSSGTIFSTSMSSSKADPRLLSFHARNIPSITITAYLNRILKYCPTDPEVFISVLVYFDRILRIASDHAQPIFGSYYPTFNVSHTSTLVRTTLPLPAHDDTFTIDSFNVHRLVITTIAVATKFFSDQFYTNSRYARVGGLPLAELNHLELQFLILHDFNLMIVPAEIQFYADNLLRYWLTDQARQNDKSFMGIIPPQPPTNLEHNPQSPTTPMTPGNFFSPTTPITPFNRAAQQITSSSYTPYTTSMEGVQHHPQHDRTE